MGLGPHRASARTRQTYEFGLLGPLMARDGGRAVEFGSPKHRIIVATLLLDAGRAVTVERLAETIWGDEPPRNPRRAVQLYLTRIRTLLGDGVITSRRNGYAIEAAPEQTDLGRFEFWQRQAGQAAAMGDLDAEATMLRLALTQWRGDPLTDVPSEALHHEDAPRLREQRLKVLDRRIRADLRQRRYAELISELRALTARHPFDERFRGYLMTALHAVGRRADALETYHTARRQLAEELGIAPGEELRTLHTRILTDDGSPACRRRWRAASGGPGVRGAGTGRWRH